MLINQKNMCYLFVTYLFLFSYFSHSICDTAFDNDSQPQTIRLEVLNQRISDYLDFSFLPAAFRTRISNTLIRNKFIYIGDLIQKHEQELLATDIGKKQLDAIKKALKEKGLHLGTTLATPWMSPQIEAIPIDILNQKISDYLDFSFVPTASRTQILDTLIANNIIYIGDLIQKPESILPKFERGQLDAIKKALKEKGLHLGTILTKPWTSPQIEAIPIDILNKKISDYKTLFNSSSNFQMSRRIINSLSANGIIYIGDLIQKHEHELYTILRHRYTQLRVTKKVLALIHEKLHLGTTLATPWTPPQLISD